MTCLEEMMAERKMIDLVFDIHIFKIQIQLLLFVHPPINRENKKQKKTKIEVYDPPSQHEYILDHHGKLCMHPSEYHEVPVTPIFRYLVIYRQGFTSMARPNVKQSQMQLLQTPEN